MSLPGSDCVPKRAWNKRSQHRTDQVLQPSLVQEDMGRDPENPQMGCETRAPGNQQCWSWEGDPPGCTAFVALHIAGDGGRKGPAVPSPYQWEEKGSLQQLPAEILWKKTHLSSCWIPASPRAACCGSRAVKAPILAGKLQPQILHFAENIKVLTKKL